MWGTSLLAGDGAVWGSQPVHPAGTAIPALSALSAGALQDK
jgi:hypothetical protein